MRVLMMTVYDMALPVSAFVAVIIDFPDDFLWSCPLEPPGRTLVHNQIRGGSSMLLSALLPLAKGKLKQPHAIAMADDAQMVMAGL